MYLRHRHCAECGFSIGKTTRKYCNDCTELRKREGRHWINSGGYSEMIYGYLRDDDHPDNDFATRPLSEITYFNPKRGR